MISPNPNLPNSTEMTSYQSNANMPNPAKETESISSSIRSVPIVIKPLQVYMRRKEPISNQVLAQSSKPVLSNEFVPPISLIHSKNNNDLHLPIAIWKGTRTCTQYPTSLFVIFNKFSKPIRVFLPNYIP